MPKPPTKKPTQTPSKEPVIKHSAPEPKPMKPLPKRPVKK